MNITHDQIIKAFRENKTDKYHLHRYDAMYYNIFKECQPIKKLLEIGIKEGYSIGAWLDIFPEAEIVGLDITLENVIYEKAKNARLVEHDSINPLVRDVVKDVFDVIIDDGSHHPIDQWFSFLIFQGRWTQCYIIEDVIGIEHVRMIGKYLRKKGFKYKTFISKKQNAIYRMRGEEKLIAFYAIAIYPKN
jgi:hypothetical protein